VSEALNVREARELAVSRNGGQPFFKETYLGFYQSLIGHYWKAFASIVGLMGSYSALISARIVFAVLLLDALKVYFGLEPEGLIGGLKWVYLFAFHSSLIRDLRQPESFFWFLSIALGLFILVAIVMAICYYVKEYMSAKLIVRMTVDVRQSLFKSLGRQSVAYFTRQRSGDVISRITNDVTVVNATFKVLFESLIQQPLTAVGALVTAAIFSPFLFVISAPFYLLLMLPILRSTKKVRKHGRGRLEKLGVVTEAIQQLFSGIRIVKAFGMERHEEKSFVEKNKGFITSTMKMNRAKIKGRSVQELMYNIGTAGLLLLGIWTVSLEFLTVTEFVGFLLAMIQAYHPLKAASKAWNVMQESRGGVERILEVLHEEPLIQDRHGALDFPGVKAEIQFEHVSFSYTALDPKLVKGAEGVLPLPVIHDVSLRVNVGEVVALVGQSGGGKSTLVDLLARFYDPQKGQILVDGKDIRDYRFASYLEAIAIVSQDPFLFNTTIRENIRYGRDGANTEEVEEAARVALAHDFILDQPDGYDTLIGERGVKLSGGQRQRITIARAVLKNAPILILDEATSSLDSQSEREVQRAIDNLIRHRTTFVIAHRLSTIVHADKILVVDQGRIVERGCHKELLESKGRYHDLWRSQNLADSTP
jgi:subfamily B ATP-binding cassette protein MsbA